jgi:hypothetical protein
MDVVSMSVLRQSGPRCAQRVEFLCERCDGSQFIVYVSLSGPQQVYSRPRLPAPCLIHHRALRVRCRRAVRPFNGWEPSASRRVQRQGQLGHQCCLLTGKVIVFCNASLFGGSESDEMNSQVSLRHRT